MLFLVAIVDFISTLHIAKNKWTLLKFLLSYALNITEGFIEMMFMGIFLQVLIDSYKQMNRELSEVSFCSHTITRSVAMKNLEDLKTKHYDLCALATETNRVFGIPVLLAMAVNFQAMTGCFYVLWTSARGNSNKISNPAAIGWCMVLLLHTWLLLKKWVALSEEVIIFLKSQPHVRVFF